MTRSRRTRARAAAAGDVRAGLPGMGRRIGAVLDGQDPGAVRRLRLERNASLASRDGQGMGDRRVFDAARIDHRALAARGEPRPPRRADPGDPTIDRSLASSGDRSRQARGADDHGRLRRAAGRRRHSDGGDHRWIHRPRARPARAVERKPRARRHPARHGGGGLGRDRSMGRLGWISVTRRTPPPRSTATSS